MPMSEANEAKKETLTDFIEVNGKLISLLGGLAALAAVAQKMPDYVKLSIPDSLILKLIPFFLFVLAIRTFVEIMRNFRGYSWYGELFLFREVFFLVMVCFVWVFLKAYYPLLITLLILAVVGIAMALILSFFLFLIKAGFKMSWFNSLSQKTKDTLTPLMALTLFMGFGAVIKYFMGLWLDRS
jgi:hypothetical protein